MSQRDITQLKRAVYTGLKPFFQGDDLLKAMVLWEDNHAHQPTFSVRFYLAELKQNLNCSASIKDMLLNLVASLSQSDSILMPDPSSAIEAFRKRQKVKPPAGQRLPEIEAFKSLIDKWLSLIDGPNGFHIVRFVSRSLERIAIANELRFNVASWLDNKNHPIYVSAVQLNDLRRITNLFYVGCCEYLGPVKADQLLSDALRQLESNGSPGLRDALGKLL